MVQLILLYIPEGSYAERKFYIYYDLAEIEILFRSDLVLYKQYQENI